MNPAKNSQGLLLARGNTAEIYAWGDGQILKLYLPGYLREEAEREAAQVRCAQALGISTPAALDVVDIDGRSSVIFERVHGPTMFEVMLADPSQRVQITRTLAELHATLHVLSASDFPALRTRVRARLETVGDARIQRILDTLPGGDALCHGDFHPGNVLLTDDGPVLIDWVDAACGRALADVARTLVLVRYAVLPDRIDEAIRHGFDEWRGQFEANYLAYYRQVHSVDEAELLRWVVVMAAARLTEAIPAAETKTLYAAIESLLPQLP